MGLTYEQLKAMGATPGGAPAPVAPAASSVPAPAPVDPAAPKKKYTYQELVAQGAQATPAAPVAPSAPKESFLSSLAKGIFGAPATLLARPVQAVAALAGASNDQIDEFTHKIPLVGGLIADAPDTYTDVKKDVGRAAQTIALGTGAPIAGGALFGTGMSLEQGNDLFSSETAINAALGGAGGKVLGWVGKPLLSATGKVVGVITPQIIKDVAGRGAGAIQKFAAEHQLLGGVAAPASEKIAGGLQKVDDVIEGGVGKVFTGAKNVAQSQYPNASATQHFQNVNERDIVQPTKVSAPAYAKAKAVYDKATGQGIDLGKVASEQRVLHHEIAEGGKYNTADTVEQLRNSVYEAGGTKARPAIKIASYETPRVPNEKIHTEMRRRVDELPATEADAEEKAAMIKAIDRRYGDTSAAAKAHPDGYDLTNLHDNRIRAGKNGHYVPGVSDLPTTAKAKLSRLEESVFRDTFDKAAPKELKIDEFRRESQKILTLADYLEKLHMKKVPEGVTKKAVRLFGRAVAATVGGKVAGFPGAILGSQYGDMLFGTFEAFPSPIKVSILNRTMREEPEAFKAIVNYIGVKEAERLLQKKLPAAGATAFKAAEPTFFTTPGGKSTTIKGEAFDIGNVDSGKIKAPKSGRKIADYLRQVDEANFDPTYTPDKELPVIKMGPKKKSPRNLNDIF